MFGFGKRDEPKQDDNYATSFDAARRQTGSETTALPSASVSRSVAASPSRASMPSPSGGGYPGGRIVPAHMDDNEKIVIQQRRRNREGHVIKKEESSMFMEKMASIVGPSYVFALVGGAFYGLTLTVPPKARRTTRILLNSYLNNVGKTSSRFANNTAAAVLLYVFTGKLINFIFLEELEDFKLSGLAQNAIYGGVAGAIYKSTRGVRPMMLSAILGATIGSGYSYLWKEGYFDIGKSSNQHFGNIQMGRHKQ